MLSSLPQMAGELTKFLEDRESSYRRLETLLTNAFRGGLKRFNRDELVELGHLYRLAAADLARARYVLRSPLLAEYLNELVGRAHHLIHRRRTSIIKSVVRFVAVDFPVTVRREFRPILLAIILLFGAGIIGGFAYMIDPQWGQLVLNQPSLRQYEQMLEQSPAGLATAIEEEMMPAASAFVISNNIRVCIIAAAGGILFGIWTLISLVLNGFLLGVIGIMFLSRGPEYDIYFWAGILPHGVLELPAICISGGAGFLLARGLLIPGKLSRGDALRREGRNAMKLLGGVLLVLILAGLIEGFITPVKSDMLPPTLKILFAFILLAAFIWYFLMAGRKDEKWLVEIPLDRTTTHLRLE